MAAVLNTTVLTTDIGIDEDPSSQFVPLGENATFGCSAHGALLQCRVRIGLHSYHFTHTTDPHDLLDRGIIVHTNRDGDIFEGNIVINGRMENNRTTVQYTIWNEHRTNSVSSETAILTVIGELFHLYYNVNVEQMVCKW